MKLIENISIDNTILSYFPGVDYIQDYTLQNPTIFHKIYQKENDYFYINFPKFINISEQPKYLFIKFEPQINYQIFINQNNYYSCQVIAFDYFNCSLNNIKNNENYLIKQKIGKIYQNYNWQEKRINFKFEKPILLLLKIYAVDYYSTNQSIKFCLSNPPMEFDYSDHWIRDWQNKIHGNSWDCSGKINDLLNLKSINRNNEILYNIVKYWKNGIKSYILPCDKKLNSFNEMKNYFNEVDEQNCNILEKINIQNSFLGYNSQFIIKFKFYFYSPSKQGDYLHIQNSGECAIRINDQYYYFENQRDIYPTWETGYNEVQVYYNCYDENIAPEFIIERFNNLYSTVLENESNINKYIPLNEIFSTAINRSIFDGYISVSNNDFNITCHDIDNYCTISFWLRIRKTPLDKETDIIKSNTISIKIKSLSQQNTILIIKHIEDQNDFEIAIEKNKWNHICVVMSKAIISYYLNFSNNNFHKIDFSGSYDNNYIIGNHVENDYINDVLNTSYDIYNIIIFNQAKKQNQVNRLYLNQKI